APASRRAQRDAEIARRSPRRRVAAARRTDGDHPVHRSAPERVESARCVQSAQGAFAGRGTHVDSPSNDLAAFDHKMSTRAGVRSRNASLTFVVNGRISRRCCHHTPLSPSGPGLRRGPGPVYSGAQIEVATVGPTTLYQSRSPGAVDPREVDMS